MTYFGWIWLLAPRFASLSTLSFQYIPQCDGTHHKTIPKFLNLKRCIRYFISKIKSVLTPQSHVCKDCKTDLESTHITIFKILVEISMRCCKAKSIAYNSHVNMDMLFPK